jgi:hypothetical protein
VHVLGARFGTIHAALTALRELRTRFGLAEHDAEIRPLGSTQYDAPTSDLILAARFEPELVAEVVAILEHLGGNVVVEHPEWPGSPPPAESALLPPRSSGYGPGDNDSARAGPGRSTGDHLEAIGLAPERRDRVLYPRPVWRRSAPRNLRRT